MQVEVTDVNEHNNRLLLYNSYTEHKQNEWKELKSTINSSFQEVVPFFLFSQMKNAGPSFACRCLLWLLIWYIPFLQTRPTKKDNHWTTVAHLLL